MQLSEKGTTLTPDGARLLRQARDRILANPEDFDMGIWHCKSYACIGGTICMIARIADDSSAVSMALGFGGHPACEKSHPLYPLFFEWDFGRGDIRDVHVAAERINAFLWDYGYPPSEVADVEPAHGDAVAGDAALTQADTSR